MVKEINGVICLKNYYAIGPWSNLPSELQDISMNIYGCQGNDTLRGTPNNDLLIGGSGADYFYDRAGDDKICGNKGSSAPCQVFSNCNNDTGPDGNDRVYGYTGKDDVWGHGGDDIISFSPYTGSKFVNGGPGNDIIHGGSDIDQLFGDDGNDYIYGEGGNDKWLSGCKGSDHVYGGAGADGIYEDICANYRDSLSWPNSGDEGDFLYGFDGSASNTSDCGDGIRGFMGDDEIHLDGNFCGSGNETAVGGSGNDTIYGGPNSASNNLIIGDYLGDWYSNDPGSPGNDILYGGPDDDEIYGGDGDDYIEGDHADTIGSGCDYIDGGGGNDDIATYKFYPLFPGAPPPSDYDIGDDGCMTYNTVLGGDGEDYIFGSDRVDHLWGGNNIDGIFGFGGDDWICSNCDDVGLRASRHPEGIWAEYSGGKGNDYIIAYTNYPDPEHPDKCLMLFGDFYDSYPETDGPDDNLCYFGNGQAPDGCILLNGTPNESDCCECDEGFCGSFSCSPYCGPGGTCSCDCTDYGLFDCTCP